jgi:hypothetical protein
VQNELDMWLARMLALQVQSPELKPQSHKKNVKIYLFRCQGKKIKPFLFVSECT